jgi:lysosomal Pro-X carboxypeptidase
MIIEISKLFSLYLVAMEHNYMLYTWLPLMFFFNLTTTHSLMIPRLSPFREQTLHDLAALISNDTKDVETFYYKQVLDHFNYRPESYNTFDQRYLINFKYWGGANSSAPILVYLGAESSIDGYPNGIGFLYENAATFKALLVYIEVLKRNFLF